ncbi:MAG: alpha-mannosidase [Vulcanococcus sp.]
MVRSWIETFQAQTRLDLLPLWLAPGADGGPQPALADPWGAEHRPDWHARGLLIWPRGGRWRRLHLELVCPPAWREQQRGDRQARLVLRWWAEAMELRVDGRAVHAGDLFDSACRWLLPERWWQGQPLQLELDLRSPLHDDGALIDSRIELEPIDPADPAGLLAAPALALAELRLSESQRPMPPAALTALAAQLADLDPADPAAAARLGPWLQQAAEQRPAGGFQVLGHAHLDLAWLWPVADTWQAAIRTFESALVLLERHSQLHFAHSTPALYAWIERHRPALFARIRAAMRAGRWEPINGPWVESDCVLISTASLLRQFQLGQAYSCARFPEWRHELCWLPDSFGFGAGLPAVAAATGVRWFCTHKLAWNATNPFPHRLFRWRSRCGAELLALMTAPIGTDGDPLAMERYRLQWQAGTGLGEALWLPGVGDHGGGPTEEMLQQLELWQQQPLACPQRHGTLRAYLERLEPLAPQLPVWRDELYLELHRGCATSRPDQKRHNRSLERLLREADLARALLALHQPAAGLEAEAPDWRPLLFQQFHDILPGTSIRAVFDQAEPQWRAARRASARLRDQTLARLLGPLPPAAWWLMALQPHSAGPITLRLPPGRWRPLHPASAALGPAADAPPAPLLPSQPAPGGGVWVQLPWSGGIAALALRRELPAGPADAQRQAAAPPEAAPVEHPVALQELGAGLGDAAGRRWLLSNGLVRAELAGSGVHQLWGADGRPQLAEPLQWCRWRDHGEFWDAWDLAADYRDHPLPLEWQTSPQVQEHGPLCARLVWRGRCGLSPLRLDVQLRAGSPWLELTLRVDWCQCHELLRLEIPLASPALRLAADTSGGVLERPARARTPREQARWEVPAISWFASQAGGADGDGAAADCGGLAVLLDGPQGVSGTPERLGVSLLRAPTWPDPGADHGPQRLRLALMPLVQGWRQQEVPSRARCFREPLWLRPAAAGDAVQAPCPALTLGDAALQWIALEPGEEAGELWLTVQNLSPLRQPLRLAPGWRQLDGPAVLAPWQLLRLRLGRVLDQSS